MKPLRLTAALTLLTFTLTPAISFGAVDSDIPQAPSIPTQFKLQAPDSKLFHCERSYTYEGKTLICDSSLRQDGEGLRPVLKNTPQATTELDQYQSTRREIKTTAYVASAGILVALISLLVAKSVSSDTSNPDASDNAGNIRKFGVGGGLAIAVTSFIYGFTSLRANESRLDHAVQFYNSANPQKPIEIQLSTGIHF